MVKDYFARFRQAIRALKMFGKSLILRALVSWCHAREALQLEIGEVQLREVLHDAPAL